MRPSSRKVSHSSFNRCNDLRLHAIELIEVDNRYCHCRDSYPCGDYRVPPQCYHRDQHCTNTPPTAARTTTVAADPVAARNIANWAKAMKIAAGGKDGPEILAKWASLKWPDPAVRREFHIPPFFTTTV